LDFSDDTWKKGNHNHETAKIKNCTLIKSNIYFQFVLKTIDVESTTLPSRMQNLVKIGKELQTQLFKHTPTQN